MDKIPVQSIFFKALKTEKEKEEFKTPFLHVLIWQSWQANTMFSSSATSKSVKMLSSGNTIQGILLYFRRNISIQALADKLSYMNAPYKKKKKNPDKSCACAMS